MATGAEGIKTEEEVAMFGGKAGSQYDECYHLLCDNITNLDLNDWEVITKVRQEYNVPHTLIRLTIFPAHCTLRRCLRKVLRRLPEAYTRDRIKIAGAKEEQAFVQTQGQ